MNRLLASVLMLLMPLGWLPLSAVVSTQLLNDPFDDLNNWKDLSLALDWGDSNTPASAMSTAMGWAQFSESVSTSWVGYGETKLNMFQALDLQFSAPIQHDRSVLRIEFRIRWEDAVSGNGNGEGNRFIVAVNHDYPPGGIDLTQKSRARDGTFPWFARPAYQIRIRGGVENSQAEPILMYGGGLDPEGEYEYNSSLQYWFAGFVASVGWGHLDGLPDQVQIIPPGLEYGFSNGGKTSPGVFPWSSYDIIHGGIASSNWQRFIYLIYPDRQEVWRNPLDSSDLADYNLEMSMPLPAEDLEPGAPLYKYFEQLEGIRLFWRNGNNVSNAFLDWITITNTVYDSNYQFWASEHFGDVTVADDTMEADTWGPNANPDGDPFPNGVERYLNQSPLVHNPLLIEEANLISGEYSLFADVEFTEYPDPLFEFYPLTPADNTEASQPGFWGAQANTDGDAYTNAAEQLLGKDPLVADPDPTGGVHIKFDWSDGILAAIHEVDSTVQGATAELQMSTNGTSWDVPVGTEHYRVWREDGTYSVVTKMPLPDTSEVFLLRFEVNQ